MAGLVSGASGGLKKYWFVSREWVVGGRKERKNKGGERIWLVSFKQHGVHVTRRWVGVVRVTYTAELNGLL